MVTQAIAKTVDEQYKVALRNLHQFVQPEDGAPFHNMSVDAEIQEVNESQTDKVQTNLIKIAVKCILKLEKG